MVLPRSSQKSIVIYYINIILDLDVDTQDKLQALIQNHMLRLLTRIDEENHSISEKSSTYNL
jgi:hypothetical protein